MDFTGQTAVVAGATRGIGRAIATSLLEGGARVLGLYRADARAAEEFAASATARGLALELYRCDVADFAAVEAFYSAAAARIEHLEILVVSSGVRRDGVLAMMRPEAWNEVLAVNLGGSYHMARFAVPWMMRARYGRIVLVGSSMSHAGFAGQANYTASKAGQIGLVRSLSKEVASRGITVNCLSPGFVETDFIADLDAKQREEYARRVPLGRFGKPEEVAAAALFLCSRAASYVNGAVLEVNGGL